MSAVEKLVADSEDALKINPLVPNWRSKPNELWPHKFTPKVGICTI